MTLLRLSLLVAPALFVALTAGCPPVDIEGNEPGECADGADNDSDGLYDCNDPDCAGAPDCATGDDDDDATGDDDDDTAGEPFTVTATTSGGGGISPAGATSVTSGAPLRLTLSPEAGMEASGVEGTCGGILEGLVFTTDAVWEDCTVVANFQPEEVEPAPYCSGIRADLASLVTCDPDDNLDDWSLGGSSGVNGVMIPSGRILSLPFTANAPGVTGYVEITNNMPGLVATGLSWHGWWSVVPAGERVEDNPYCRSFSYDPNPRRLQWNQSEAAEWECHLGVEPRTLYFNMEVACPPKLGTDCTPGERYAGDYYLQLSHGPD